MLASRLSVVVAVAVDGQTFLWSKLSEAAKEGIVKEAAKSCVCGREILLFPIYFLETSKEEKAA